MLKLYVVVTSTRPGKVGAPIGQWFYEFARDHGKFDVELVDLEQIDLPLIDEPNHPRLANYQNQHTKDWSAKIDAADAFVLITPEYNYSAPPALLNALDYLYREWHYKPVGFVSYGGVSGGTRSVQVIKGIVTTLKMMPLPESVIIPFVARRLNEDNQFGATEIDEKAATTMLDELHRWTEALKPLRNQ